MSCMVTVIMVRYSVKVFGECYGNGRWGVGEGGNVGGDWEWCEGCGGRWMRSDISGDRL